VLKFAFILPAKVAHSSMKWKIVLRKALNALETTTALRDRVPLRSYSGYLNTVEQSRYASDKIITIFNFVGILEISTIGEVISNTTWVSKQISVLKNKLKNRIKKHPGETCQ
jgi:hypothetical protein